jgi:hypothetical protein
VARKPIKTSLYFESSFKVKGKVTQVVLCGCENEGDLGFRVTRDAKTTWDYDPEDPETFFDVYAYCDDDSWKEVHGGDWIEGTLSCAGYLRKVWGGKVYLEKDALTPGGRKVGRVVVADDRVTVDFGVFSTGLQFEDPEKLRKALRAEGLRDGSFAETDCDVYVKVSRHGTKKDVLREKAMKQVFPAKAHESRYHG